MSGATSEPVDADAGDGTLELNEGQQSRAQERSAGRAEVRPELPGYEVQRQLGRGAYGEVWLAIQENTGRPVAVKVFGRHRGLDWPLLKREVGKLVQVLSERRIVHLLAVGWDADPPYYIMEYLQGGSLADKLGGEPMAVDEAVPLFKEVAEALVYLHSKAILHCDLKPSNVLLDDRGQVRLADFGQARLSDEEGPPAGTLFYMAPELTDSKARPDVRSDVYSLGALFYSILTGRPPYAVAGATRDLASTGTLSDRIQRYRTLVDTSSAPTEHHRIPGVDKDLAAIVDRCLRRNPGERFANVQQVLDALAARDRRRTQRPLLVFGLLGPAVLLAALFGVGWWALKDARERTERIVTKQALEGNLELAGAAAMAVDSRLSGIKRRIEREAGRSELADLLAGVQAARDEPQRAILRQRLQSHVAGLYKRYERLGDFYSWIVADRDAFLWARYPPDPTVTGKPYLYREWFNGRRDYAPGKVPPGMTPREEIGFTGSFTSTAKEKPILISAGSPVRSKGGEIVGVLAASFEPNRFDVWLEKAETGSDRADCPSRFVVLVNHRGQEVRHPCPHAEAPKFDRVVDLPEVKALLRTETDDDYVDAMRPGESYLAAASRLPENPGWFVIVQQSPAVALQPVAELAEQFGKLGRIALAVGLAVAAVLWLLLLQVTRAAPSPRAEDKPAKAAGAAP